MTTPAEVEAKFWKAIKSDRTLMLGLSGVDEGLGQPMTAQLDKHAERGPIYIFTAKDTDFVRSMGERHLATANFVARDHDLFAAIKGEVFAHNDRSTIDRLWNRFVAAWFEGGKDDPKLQLLRFEPRDAQIWLNENSLFAGVKLLLGSDPKQDYLDKVAQVRLT